MRRLTARLMRACIVASMVLTAMTVPALAGTDSGEVTFRLTLGGTVQPDDGFYIDVRCDGGDFCNGMDTPRNVTFCGTEAVADAPLCVREDQTFEFTVTIPTQRIDYTLYRIPDLNVADPVGTPVLSGSWDVHDGEQTISLGYDYPGGEPAAAPVLPDTALPAGG